LRARLACRRRNRSAVAEPNEKPEALALQGCGYTAADGRKRLKVLIEALAKTAHVANSSIAASDVHRDCSFTHLNAVHEKIGGLIVPG